MKALEGKIFEEEKTGLQQIDEEYEAEVDNITRIQDETITTLLNGVNETKKNLKLASTSLLNQARRARQRQLESLGVPQDEIDAHLETEITPEKVLDNELAAIQQMLLRCSRTRSFLCSPGAREDVKKSPESIAVPTPCGKEERIGGSRGEVSRIRNNGCWRSCSRDPRGGHRRSREK
jgi:hypothetical protein